VVVVIVRERDVVDRARRPPTMALLRVLVLVADFAQKVDTLVSLQIPHVHLLQSYSAVHSARRQRELLEQRLPL
jgi:hypothetical protein